MAKEKAISKKTEEKGIANVEIGEDYLEVEFLQPSKDGYIYYRYDEANPGKSQVAEMKKIAKNKKLLAEYIEKEVRKMYSQKW